MDQGETLVLRSELVSRRRKLESATSLAPQAAELRRLLEQVDSALDRMDRGTYGLCDVCHDPIEADRLKVDPLMRVCLDHLAPDERRALEDDLDLALRIQTTLLPSRNLEAGAWRAHYHYQPAGPVSGDYCDLILSDSSLFFMVGDVAGKGVASSLLMSHLHAIIRSLLSVGMPVAQLMERANRLFCESTMPAHYATLICGRASASGEVELCNAGHCRPAIVRHGEVATMEPGGVPLGLFCSVHYTTQRFQLEPGDLLILYTDGVSEAGNPAGVEYGEDRVLRVAAGCHQLPAETAARKVLDDLTAFRDGARQADDLTLMAIQRGDSAR
jgi:phosphoserine phosphatase RsbU/P